MWPAYDIITLWCHTICDVIVLNFSSLIMSYVFSQRSRLVWARVFYPLVLEVRLGQIYCNSKKESFYYQSVKQHATKSERYCKAFWCKPITVSRLLKQVAKTGSGSPQRKGKCGRKRKTSPRDDIFLIRQSKLDRERPALTSREI